MQTLVMVVCWAWLISFVALVLTLLVGMFDSFFELSMSTLPFVALPWGISTLSFICLKLAHQAGWFVLSS